MGFVIIDLAGNARFSCFWALRSWDATARTLCVGRELDMEETIFKRKANAVVMNRRLDDLYNLGVGALRKLYNLRRCIGVFQK